MSENEQKDRNQQRARARRSKSRTDADAPRDVAEAATPAKPASKRRATARKKVVAPPLTDREAVLEANAHFYRAFEIRDVAAMAELWAREPYVRCIHPGWEPLVGWDEVVGSWGQIFGGAEMLRFELADVAVRVGGDMAWVELAERLEARQGNQRARSTVLATNIFERRADGRWQLVHHHASPVMVKQPTPRRGGETVH